MNSPASRSITANLRDENGEEIEITAEMVEDGLRWAVSTAHTAASEARMPASGIAELRRCAAEAQSAAEAAEFWAAVAEEHKFPAPADAWGLNPRLRAAYAVPRVQEHLSAVLDRLAEVEALLAAQAAEDEAAHAEEEDAILAAAREGRLTEDDRAVIDMMVARGIASPAIVALVEREVEVENLAVLAEGAVLDDAEFLAAYREGRLTNAQWAVMALRVGAGAASPEVAALVEREATNAAQWAFLLR